MKTEVKNQKNDVLDISERGIIIDSWNNRKHKLYHISKDGKYIFSVDKENKLYCYSIEDSDKY